MAAKVRSLFLVASLSLICASALAQSAFQINYDSFRKAIVFIYARGADGQTQPDGTGFLVGIPSKSKPGHQYIFLVTARHMVDSLWIGCPEQNQAIVARFNKKGYDPNANEPGTVDYDLPGDQSKGARWIRVNDESVDIAFTLLDASKLDSMGADYSAVLPGEFPSPEELKTIETGAQIMSAGLLPGASGNKRNYPIFKFGHVSSRPDEKFGFKVCEKGNEIAGTQWMIAANLVPGNSGSPILFVPLAFGGITFGGAGRAFLMGVQSTYLKDWDIAGMAPIQSLAETFKSLNFPDLDTSTFGVAASLLHPEKAPPTVH